MTAMARSLVVLALMVAAAWLSFALRPTQKMAASGEPVRLERMIPARFGEWREDDALVPIPPAPEQKALLQKVYDQVLARTYIDAAGNRVMLSIAYSGDRHEGMDAHSPEICYPAQGFQLAPGPAEPLPAAGAHLPLRRLVASRGPRHEPISYWFVVGGEPAGFGLGHKLATLKHGLTGRIPDGMLVRVSSLDPDERHAYGVHDRFIRSLLAALAEPDRQRLLGALRGG